MRYWFLFFAVPTIALGAPCDGAPGKNHKNPDGSQGGFVANTARVSPTVFLDASSSVCEQAKVQGNVKIKSGSWVAGSANIEGNSEIVSSRIYGISKVYGKAQVVDSAVCQASDINFKVSNSEYYCQTDDPEPKDPGESGKKSLIGVDSDVDGVRDDVEIWINSATTNTKTRDMYNMRMILKEIARKFRQNLLVRESNDASRDAQVSIIRSLECLDDLSQSSQEFEFMHNNIYKRFFNTIDRMKAEAKIKSSLAGYSETVTARKKKSTCPFKLR